MSVAATPSAAKTLSRYLWLSKIITLTTDFSTSDAYVGAMKGAMLSVAPDATIVDLAHDIAPHDVFQAAFVLESAYRYFPEGTVHVVVVDPGVGTLRRRLAIRCGGYYFVGPDNGVFSYPIRKEGLCECVEIAVTGREGRMPSATFEGRDIFGPAGARIANGTPLSELGPALESVVELNIPTPVVSEKLIEGRIIYIDHFGNCVSNITSSDLNGLNGRSEVIVGGHSVGRLRPSYADVEVGDAVAIINSVDHLEVAINQGSAEQDLNIKVGTKIRVVASE